MSERKAPGLVVLKNDSLKNQTILYPLAITMTPQIESILASKKGKKLMDSLKRKCAKLSDFIDERMKEDSAFSGTGVPA